MVVGSFLGIFKRKPKLCSNCGAPQERLHNLDETWRGRFRVAGEQERKVCNVCLEKLFPRYFESFSGRCILQEPVARSNAYYGYTLEERDLKLVAVGSDYNKELRERTARAIQLMLDCVSGRCERCDTGAAAFLWIAGHEFNNDWWNSDRVKLAEQGAGTPICGKCAGALVTDRLIALDVEFGELNPTREGAVLMFSGEA